VVGESGHHGVLGKELRGLFRIASPLIIHNLAHMGMQFTDTVMSGRLSPLDLAAVAVGANVWMALFLLGMGTLMVTTPTVAQLYGAGRQRVIGAWVRQALWLALFVAFVGFFLIRQAHHPLTWIGIGPEIVGLASGYLNAVSWGLPAVLAYSVLRFTSEGIGHTRPMLYIAVLAVGLNIFGNWVLMWGNLGFPRMGAVGCGYATAIVMWCMFATLFIYSRRRRSYRPLAIWSRFDPPSPARQAALFRVGFPIGVAIFMEGGLFAATAFLMGRLGTEVVAAHQIAVNFSATLFMVPLGLSMGITARVGQAIGRGDPAAARYSGIVGIATCAVIMAIGALILVTFPTYIASIYTQDAAVISLAAKLMIMAAIFQLSDGIQVAAAGCLRGYKDTRIPMWYTVLAYWLIGFPLAILLGVYLDLGPRWIWAGLIAGLTAAALLLTRRFLWRSRQVLT
jgi:multidrug resistance protein, MATE family